VTTHAADLTSVPPGAALGLDVGGTSVKAALLAPGAAPRFAVSDPYVRPDADTLRAALRTAAERLGDGQRAACVGLCLPGKPAPTGDRIALAVNVPGLVGVPFPELAAAALQRPVAASSLRVVSDAHAAAFDWHHTHRPSGRLFALALGTGVGACILEVDGTPLRLSPTGPGHWGQIDVGPCDPAHPGGLLGPDGGRNSAEAYLGLPALRARFGPELEAMPDALAPADPAMTALARLLRVATALTLPTDIALLGGLALRLAPSLPALRTAFRSDLSRVASPPPTIQIADHAHHAALGAARLAAASASPP
jgi:predicted NBD/HSP70 family sugar kinase